MATFLATLLDAFVKDKTMIKLILVFVAGMLLATYVPTIPTTIKSVV
jgi:hypothetical protein